MKIVPTCANAGQLSNNFALAKAAFAGGDIHEGIARRVLALRTRRTNYGEGQFFAGPEHGDEAHVQSIC
jgi:hypothetical protein